MPRTYGYQPTGDTTPGTPPTEPAGASSARTRHSFAVTTTGPTSAQVLIDGHDIAHGVTGLTLTMGVAQVPTVTLDLAILDATEIQDVQARVLIPDATRDLLTHLGWTAPADPHAEPTEPIEITPYLVVQRYRTARGTWAWCWRCWGDGDCGGHLTLDLNNRAHAERNAREHLAAEHPDATLEQIVPGKEG